MTKGRLRIDESTVPWSRGEACPCGSNISFAHCCLNAAGIPIGRHFNLNPPGPATGYRHPKCYLGATMNCSEKISGEHLISEAISESVGNYTFYNGLANAGLPERTIVARSARANILCTRHNNATSDLDAEAGKYFLALKDAQMQMQNGSVGGRWYFINGNLLELWAIKTVINLHYSRMIEYEGRITKDNFSVNEDSVVSILTAQRMPKNAGMYYSFEPGNLAPMAFQPLVNPFLRKVIGVKLWVFGIVSHVVFDDLDWPLQPFERAKSSYRPTVVRIRKRNPRYTTRLLISWNDAGPNGPRRMFHATW